METRRLGRTELSVSEIGFGAVEIGLEYGIQVDRRPNIPNDDAAIRTVHEALALGINVIDTARGYGESERLLGAALDGRRSDIVLMSKVGPFDLTHSDDELRRDIEESIATSLRLLRTDSIDVYQVHSASLDVMARGVIVDTMDDLRRAGKCHHLGATVYTDEEASVVLDDDRLDVLQIPYSLLDASLGRDVIPRAVAQDVGVVARSVLHRGVLTAKGPAGSEDEQRLHNAALGMDFLFDEQTRSLSHAAVRFALTNAGIGCALLGMESVDQVRENLMGVEFPPFNNDQVEATLAAAPDAPWSIIPYVAGAVTGSRQPPNK